jgi:uncharacterized membrane protein YdfJ with MMPL/SSD domain
MTRPLAIGLAWGLMAWNLMSLLGFVVSPSLTTLSIPVGLAVGVLANIVVRRHLGNEPSVTAREQLAARMTPPLPTR